MARYFWLALFTGILIVNIGCQSTSKQHPWSRNNAPPPRPVFVPPPPPTIVPTQAQALPSPPPGAVLTPPAGATIVQPGQQPPAVPSISKSVQPPAPPTRVESQWKSIDPLAPITPREPARRDVPPGIRLYAPEAIDKETAEPPVKKSDTPSSFPAIAEFAPVKDSVFAGLRPPLDGLDWLQEKGVQTIVNIRLFGEDDATDRKQVESRKMRYVAFEVSPQVLTKEKVDEFIKLVRGGSVFVFDNDGSLAGSMWYLYQRFGELHGDEAAQLRAQPLGLRTNRDGQHREMWLAVQKLLGENNP